MSEPFIRGKTFHNITSVKCDLTEKVCWLFEKLERQHQVEGIDSLVTEFKTKGRIDADKDEVTINTHVPLTCTVVTGPLVSGRRETTLSCE